MARNMKMIGSSMFFMLLGVIMFTYSCNQISSKSAMLAICFTAFIRFVFLPADCDMLLTFFDFFGKKADVFEGKVVWVTGASTGIGEKLAIALSKGKAKLVLSARSEDKLKQVKQKCLEVEGLESKDVLVLPFDMTDYDKHEWALSMVLKHFNQLDVLVSNAGRSQRARWEKIETAVDRAIFDLNVFALVSLARIVTRHFLEVGKGHHAVVSSGAGKGGVPFSGSYTGSKHALNGYFECLRAEKGSKGISITVLCPGPVESNLMEGILGEKVNEKPNEKRVGQLMTSEKCAELCVVAMANKLSEAWICNHPALLFLYLTQYQPTLVRWAMNNFDFSAIATKTRDGEAS